ncbi:fumarylacetoacetate hydrolase family protein [Sphingobium sp. MK2]|uniref:fumarylacetoacetate hydrolase family protein n=1 Tax=Sphingobium sp. MK2 TaxID=3116540 RepID=UPI0032E36766
MVTIARGAAGIPGCLIGSDVLDLQCAAQVLAGGAPIPVTVAEILTDGSGGLDAARALFERVGTASADIVGRLRDIGALTALADTALLAPLPSPRLILSHGQAFHAHRRDFHKDAKPEPPKNPPAGFIKGQNSIVGPGADIVLPKVASEKVDYEGELCVVFSRHCSNVVRADAMNYVAGYTIINDVSARDWIPQMRDPATGMMTAFHALNLMYKNFPSFCPMGPNVTTADEIADHQALRLVTRLNGEVMQDAVMADLIWGIPELIEYYSARMEFHPGDIMSTGTPGGVGFGRTPPVFMREGDVISVSVDGIGTLENRIVAPPAGAA